jgi:hypothetical protein
MKPKYSRKDYELAAEIISDTIASPPNSLFKPDFNTARNIAMRFRHRFEEDNKKFDVQKFYKACGLGE